MESKKNALEMESKSEIAVLWVLCLMPHAISSENENSDMHVTGQTDEIMVQAACQGVK
jgi:hypothetical protein